MKIIYFKGLKNDNIFVHFGVEFLSGAAKSLNLINCEWYSIPFFSQTVETPNPTRRKLQNVTARIQFPLPQYYFLQIPYELFHHLK